MKYILTISLSIFCIIGCVVHQSGKAELNDSRRIFSDKKEYIYNLAFKGIVLSKVYCINCDINKYTADIQLETLNPKPTFSQGQMPPYYSFKNDSIINISISKELFEILIERKFVIKEHQSYNIKFNDSEVSLLNKDPFKWLP